MTRFIWDRLRPASARARLRAGRLADAIMSAARRPSLFLRGFARDDFDGRFHMVAVHGALVMRWLKAGGADGLLVSEKLGEVLFDRFDYAFREEGVGDASIARKVRKLGERYYGLARALDKGLAEGEPAIADILQRNGLGADDCDGLAVHIVYTDAALSKLAYEDLVEARFEWPDVRD